ncbi:10462_t:CDS:1, partial [Racocetra persica]
EFAVNQFEANLFVNINSDESSRKWLFEFEETSKMIMPQSKDYQ